MTIALLVIAAFAAPFALLATTFPKTKGPVYVSGLGDDVSIVRDRHGIPYIRSRTMEDAVFALGFVHAQDRFFQMEMIRRLGAGRLSELVGEKALASDKHMRTLGLYRLAEKQVTAGTTELRQRLDAYAAGVNAWIKQKHWPLAIEFIAFPGFRPEPWRPADSLVWGKLMAVRLANNWRTEHLRRRMANRLTLDQIDFLWPREGNSPPIVGPTISVSSLAVPALPDLAWDPRSVGAPATASNAWVIRTEQSSGKAISLANDPHLAFRAPILWYLAHIETDSGRGIGATVPGVPFVIIGHNDHVAWGFTTTGADTEDLIIEKSPDGGRHYVTPNGLSPFQLREEIIKAGGKTHRLSILSTPEGPVIAGQNTATPLTLGAPYLQAGDRTPEALLALNSAKNEAEVLAALAKFHAPVQNVFYATRHGRAGYHVAGRIPIRNRGDGRWPLARADGPVGNQNMIPFDSLPSERVAPGPDIILNANNRVTGPDYPHSLALDWPAPFRAARLATLLSRPIKDVALPQRDILSTAAVALITTAHSIASRKIPNDGLLEFLVDWDGRMAREQRAPLLFHLWAMALKRRIFADELGNLYDEWHGLRIRALNHALATESVWCDNITTKNREETCQMQINSAFDDADAELAEIDKNIGRNANWGDVHRATFDHPLFGQVPGLAALTRLEIPTDGGHYTLNRGAMYLGRRDNPFAHRHGAGLRTVFSLDNLANSRFMIATGQSGNPVSPHYGDQLNAWRDGRFLTLVPPPSGDPELKLLPLGR